MPKKYSIIIRNEHNQPITTFVYRVGTPAQHFGFCAQLAIELLNGGLGPIFARLRSQIDIDQELAPSMGPIIFLTELHTHAVISPEVFLYLWGNQENRPDFLNKLVDSEEYKQLFIQFLEQIRIPGVGSCNVKIIEPIHVENGQVKSLQDLAAATVAKYKKFFFRELANLSDPIADKYPHLDINAKRIFIRNVRNTLNTTDVISLSRSEIRHISDLYEALNAPNPYNSVNTKIREIDPLTRQHPYSNLATVMQTLRPKLVQHLKQYLEDKNAPQAQSDLDTCRYSR